MVKHILIPTDGSKLSHWAVVAGVKLARALGARVTGLFAAPAATPLAYRGLLPEGACGGQAAGAGLSIN